LFLSDKYASHCCLAPFFSSPHGPNTSEEVLIKRMADGSELCLKRENLGRASLPMEWPCFANSFNDFVISL